MRVAICTLLLYVVWCGVVSSQARPASLDATKCQIDEHCPDGKFCYKYGECANCRNCSKLGRLQPRDSNCARTKDECGPCLPGYRDTGTFCVETGAENVPLLLKNDKPPANNTDRHRSSTIISEAALPWVVVAMVIFIVPCLVCLTFYGKKRWNARSGLLIDPKRKESLEKILLTSNSAQPDFGASAPVEEEYNQLPYNYNYRNNISNENRNERKGLQSSVRKTPGTSYGRRSESRKQRALPFDAGNGSGDWAVAYPVEMDVYNGNQNALPNENHNILNHPPPSPEQPNEINIGNIDGAAVPFEGEPIVVQNRGILNGNVEHAPEPEIPHEEMQQPPTQDSFFLQFSIRALLRIFRTPREETNVHVSEAPEWMEATQMDMDVLNLTNTRPEQNAPQMDMNPRTTSNSSLDSGISSSAGDPSVVPSTENSPAAADGDVLMYNENDS